MMIVPKGVCEEARHLCRENHKKEQKEEITVLEIGWEELCQSECVAKNHSHVGEKCVNQ